MTRIGRVERHHGIDIMGIPRVGPPRSESLGPIVLPEFHDPSMTDPWSTWVTAEDADHRSRPIAPTTMFAPGVGLEPTTL